LEAYRTQRHVTYEAAADALRAGLAKAAEIGINVGLVVTDASGEVVAFGRMDGANPRAWKGALGKATVAIFDVLNSWNDFFTPLIFLNTPGNFTMSLGLGQYVVDHGGQYYNLQMAAATVMTIPVMLLFFFAQRYFMRGIVTTGLAGR